VRPAQRQICAALWTRALQCCGQESRATGRESDECYRSERMPRSSAVTPGIFSVAPASPKGARSLRTKAKSSRRRHFPRSTLPFSADYPVRSEAVNRLPPFSAVPPLRRPAFAPMRCPPWSPAIVAHIPGSRAPRSFGSALPFVSAPGSKSSRRALLALSCTKDRTSPLSASTPNQLERRSGLSYTIP
jgi:hypothetical protein